MKKILISGVVVSCSIAMSTSIFAFGNINSSIAASGGNRLNPGKSYSINISLPTNLSSQSNLIVPTASRSDLGKLRFVDFDAKNIPVHELPPLPLTLDAPEQEP